MNVESLHRKSQVAGERGIPKSPVPFVDVDEGGVEGDFNRYRHESRRNDPEQAVLVHCAESLEQLAREGWPVQRGDLGENLLLRGVPYATLGPGVEVRVGEVELVITKPAKPCKNLAVLPYIGDERLKTFVRALRNRRGWYARVSRGGRVAVGDPVEIKAAQLGLPDWVTWLAGGLGHTDHRK